MGRGHGSGRPREDEEPTAESARPGGIQELMRRAMALGFSGFFTTEEALRRALGDNLPQEWVDFATTQGERTRQDFARAVASEFGRVLEQVDFAELLSEMLRTHPVEIHATVRLLPPDDEGRSHGSVSGLRVELATDGERGGRDGDD